MAIAEIVKERASFYPEDPLAQVARVEVGRERIRVSVTENGEEPTEIEASIQLKFRNNTTLIQPEGQRRIAPGVDHTLVRALALATDWARRLESGEVASVDALAREEQRCERYTASIIPLAYLAPDLVARIVEGRQPQAMTLAALTDEPLPVTWAAQRRRFAAFD